MTAPGAFEPLIKRQPADVSHLSSVVQGLLVHSEWLAAYRLDPCAYHSVSRATLPVSERLAALLADGRALDESRTPAARAVGTCRDFALLLCSFLRTLGRPARVRCGFASYFTSQVAPHVTLQVAARVMPNVMPGEGPASTTFRPTNVRNDRWEDHWICEYWDKGQQKWHLVDAQLDEVTRAACNVVFDPLDLPPGVFLTAGEAWLRCRNGEADPDSFGNATTKGLWFISVNVMRDAYVMNNRETSVWDRWREASPEHRVVLAHELPALDNLARNPAQPISGGGPPWLTSRAGAAYSRSGAG